MKDRQKIRTAWQNRLPTGIRARRVLFGGLAFVLVGLLLCVVLSVTLSRQKITGVFLSADSSSVYSSEELIEASGLLVGDGFWVRSERDVEKAVKKTYPAVESVRLNRLADGRISLTVTDVKAAYLASIDGEAYVLDADLRVLRRANGDEELIRLRLPREIEVVPGEIPDLGRDSAYDLAFVETLLQSPIGPSVTGINLEKRYYLTALYNGRVRILFGTSADLDKKLTLCAEIFRSTDYLTIEYAELDVSDLEKSVLHPCDKATATGDFTD